MSRCRGMERGDQHGKPARESKMSDHGSLALAFAKTVKLDLKDPSHQATRCGRLFPKKPPYGTDMVQDRCWHA